MIPEFDKNGFLPQGIHLAKLDEFENRFVYNLVRREIFQGLQRLISDLKRVACPAIFVDGSYVTAKEKPKDIDVCWDDRGADLDFVEFNLPILWDLEPPRARQQALYKADVFPAFAAENGSKKMFLDFFQQIKHESLRKKGIIKIEIYD